MLSIANYQRNGTQNYTEVSPHTSQNGHHQSLQITNAGEGVEKREPSYTVGGKANQYSHYGKQCGDSLKNCKQNYLMTQQSHCWAYTPEETRIERDTCTTMLISALFAIAGMQKQPRCPLTNEWMKKLWYMYTMEYYSAIKRNTFESVLMRWVNLQPIVQSEVSQKENDKYGILMHIYRIQKNDTEEFIYRTAMEVCFCVQQLENTHYLMYT